MIRKPGKTPKYETIFNNLLREISSNYKVGDLFQTQRDLMKRFSASYATIGHVLRKLKEQEIIATHVGKGIFIKNLPSFKALKAVKIAVFVQNNTGPQDKSITGLYQLGLLTAQEKLPCEIVFLKRSNDANEMLRQMKQASADGILFMEDSLVKLMNLAKKEGIPYIVVHPLQLKHNFCVDIDDAVGIQAAVQEMAKNGAKKIMFISRFVNQGHNIIKTNAYRMGLELVGLPYDENLIVEIMRDDDLITKLAKLRAKLHQKEDYDAILVIDTSYLELVEGALLYEKVKVPEDAQLSVFGDFGYAETCLFPLGVIHVPYKEAAMQGLEMLVKRCQGSSSQADIRLLETSFSWREAHIPPHKQKQEDDYSS